MMLTAKTIDSKTHASPGNPVHQARRLTDSQEQDVCLHHILWCPGCEQQHGPRSRLPETKGELLAPFWDYDGNEAIPTFSPSLLVYRTIDLCSPEHEHWRVCPEPDSCGATGHAVLIDDGGSEVLGHHNGHVAERGNCHSFIRNGQWEFLGDCAHKLAGQTVPLPPLPDWLCRD
jgi:hypothetical protein